MEPGTVLPRFHRVPSSSDALPEVATAQELVRRQWDHVPVPAYPELRIGSGALALASGPESSGKSTFGLKLVDSVEGPAVFVSAEMGLGPSLGGLLARLGIRRSGLSVVGRCSVDWLHRHAEQTGALVMVLDSAQALGFEPADARHLLLTTPLQALLAVSQVNKLGQPVGRREWSHEADVCIAVANMQWALTKSRYQPLPLTGAVLEGVSDAA